MSRLTAPQTEPALCRDHIANPGQAASQTTQLQTLLYGVSAVTALPSGAILAPPNVTMPEIRADSHPVLQAIELSSVLDRPVARIGHGWVALHQVDWRMRGLVASLDLSRTVDDSAMLICLGVVEPDRTASRAGAPTAVDLWDLVCETLPHDGIVREQAGIGHGALLVLRANITAQMVWLSKDRLATVTVTSLRGDAPIRGSVRSIGRVLARLLRDDGPRSDSGYRNGPGRHAPEPSSWPEARGSIAFRRSLSQTTICRADIP